MRALVTGVSRGIGRSICLKLAKDSLARGEDTTIVATATGKSDDLENTVEELRAMGVKANAVKGDLTTAEDPERIVSEALDFAGGLDALVNNAGFPIIGTLLDMKIRHWDLMFAINCRSTLLLGRSAHAALKESNGAIVAISSIAGRAPQPNLSGYSASKAALNMLVKQLAMEWGPDGIRVNCVSPGATHSRSTERAFTSEGVAEREQTIALRRVGRPEDIANAVAFLVGPQGDYITGEDLSVDGGLKFGNVAAPKNANY